MIPHRHQLGDLLRLTCWAVDGNGTPALPTASAPTAAIYAASDVATPIKTINLPVDDRYGTTARFHTMDRLDGDYSTGKHHIVYQWVISGSTYGCCEDFEIVAGGDTAGAVIGNEFIVQPHRGNVLFADDSGRLLVGRNPR